MEVSVPLFVHVRQKQRFFAPIEEVKLPYDVFLAGFSGIAELILPRMHNSLVLQSNCDRYAIVLR